MDLQTANLISDIKLAGSFPDGMFTDANYATFLNTGYFSQIMPFIMMHREDFFVTFTDYTYENIIPIPSDAIMQKLKDVIRVDSDGSVMGNMPRYAYEEISGNTNINYPGFYLEDNSVKFYPKDSISDKIRLYYFKRPNKMALESACCEVTSIDGASASGSLPSTWTTSTDITVVSHTQPFTVDDSYTIAAIDVDAGTITLSASGFVKNDFICPRGYTAIPYIPFELRDCLIQSALINAHVSLADKAAVKLAREELVLSMKAASGLISPRVDGEVKKIVGGSGIWRSRHNNRRY